MKAFRPSRMAHFTLPTALAVLALVVALSTSAAAALIITGKQIENESVTGADIRNRSLLARDLSLRTRKSLRGATGPVGPIGPAGPQGATGATGITDYTTVTNGRTVAPDSSNVAAAYCPIGLTAIGGGGYWAADPSPTPTTRTLTGSTPSGSLGALGPGSSETAVGWLVTGFNGSALNQTLVVSVLCARLG